MLIIEPDSQSNLDTKSGNSGCGKSASSNVYKTRVAYAINKFKDPNITMYLDAVHGGWLGWEDKTTEQ